MPITLPTKIYTPVIRGPSLATFYGGLKIGKSHCISKLPHDQTLVLDLQRGYDHLVVNRIEVRNYDEIIETFDAIEAAKRPYKFLVIDTIDRAEDWCEDDAMKQYRGSSLNDKDFRGSSILFLPKGAGYKWLRGSFHKLINRARLCAQHIIFIGHVRDKFLDNEKQDATVKDIDLTGKNANILLGDCDAIGHMTRRDAPKPPGWKFGDPVTQDLWVSFKSSDQINCGARNEHLRGKDILFCSGADLEPKWELIYPELTVGI